MVTTGFADRARFGAETPSARKWERSPARSGVECGSSKAEATPSPSRRGLKRTNRYRVKVAEVRSNTVPIEKGTETEEALHRWAIEQAKQHRPHREGD